MRAEVEMFNEEKKRMKAIVIRDDVIIYLNVGVRKSSTKRSTLYEVKDFLLLQCLTVAVESINGGRVWRSCIPKKLRYNI